MQCDKLVASFREVFARYSMAHLWAPAHYEHAAASDVSSVESQQG